jgi:hypothetical protein
LDFEGRELGGIPVNIPLQLVAPKLSIRCWLSGPPTPRVLVPEATMYEDHLSPSSKDQIRFAGKVGEVQAIPVS